jgi:hypothetical protein
MGHLVGSVRAVGWHHNGAQPECGRVGYNKFGRTRGTQKHSIAEFDSGVR